MVSHATLSDRQFSFELVTPEKVEVSSVEERVLLPGEEGDFLVLAGHTQLLAALRPGVVTVYQGNTTTRYFITGGFADVGNTHCIVLSPHSTPLEKLSAEKLNEEIQKTEKALGEVTEKHAQEHLQEQLELLRLKLEAVKTSG